MDTTITVKALPDALIERFSAIVALPARRSPQEMKPFGSAPWKE
mgnify:CR=1 FL=1